MSTKKLLWLENNLRYVYPKNNLSDNFEATLKYRMEDGSDRHTLY